MRVPRFFHWLFAHSLGYFWRPCPNCGRAFGGHEVAHWARLGAFPVKEINDTFAAVVCPRCTGNAAPPDFEEVRKRAAEELGVKVQDLTLRRPSQASLNFALLSGLTVARQTPSTTIGLGLPPRRLWEDADWIFLSRLRIAAVGIFLITLLAAIAMISGVLAPNPWLNLMQATAWLLFLWRDWTLPLSPHRPWRQALFQAVQVAMLIVQLYVAYSLRGRA